MLTVAPPLPRSTRTRPRRSPWRASTSYVPNASGGNVKCPFASLVVLTVRLFPDAVTTMAPAGRPPRVTVPPKKALALTAYAGAAARTLNARRRAEPTAALVTLMIIAYHYQKGQGLWRRTRDWRLADRAGRRN